MKKLIPILIAVFAFVSCEKDPDMSKLDNDYLVFTSYDKAADFSSFKNYYLPDSVMVIGNKEKPEYWKGEQAQPILDAYVENMTSRGYTRVDEKEDAQLGLQVSYIASTYYFTNYHTNPYWWWGYPGYWGSGYWGNWGGGWYYPYAINYSYSTNSFISEIVNLNAPEGPKEKIPVLWTSYMTGLVYSSSMNKALAVKGVNQAFAQSPYLTNK